MSNVMELPVEFAMVAPVVSRVAEILDASAFEYDVDYTTLYSGGWEITGLRAMTTLAAAAIQGALALLGGAADFEALVSSVLYIDRDAAGFRVYQVGTATVTHLGDDETETGSYACSEHGIDRCLHTDAVQAARAEFEAADEQLGRGL